MIFPPRHQAFLPIHVAIVSQLATWLNPRQGFWSLSFEALTHTLPCTGESGRIGISLCRVYSVDLHTRAG